MPTNISVQGLHVLQNACKPHGYMKWATSMNVSVNGYFSVFAQWCIGELSRVYPVSHLMDLSSLRLICNAFYIHLQSYLLYIMYICMYILHYRHFICTVNIKHFTLFFYYVLSLIRCYFTKTNKSLNRAPSPRISAKKTLMCCVFWDTFLLTTVFIWVNISLLLA